MEVVKTGMQHGDLSLDAYTQVTASFHLCSLITSTLTAEPNIIQAIKDVKDVNINLAGVGGMSGTSTFPSWTAAIHKVTNHTSLLQSCLTNGFNFVFSQGQPGVKEGPH